MNTCERGPNLQGLAAFMNRGDREDAVFFVGRDHEIGAVERLCTRAFDLARSGKAARGATCLFQGAPGAGKTALLLELQYRWLGTPATDDAPARSGSGAVLPVVVHWSDLGSEETVVRAILKAVDSGLDEAYRQTRSSDANVSAGVAGWFRAGKRSGQTTSPPALTFVELAEAVASFHGGSWPGPVCLMVDEIQATEQGHASVLGRVHEGVPGLPIVPVLAGLGSSEDRLSSLNVGLSRLTARSVHHIGALTHAEAREAVDRMLAAYRIDRHGKSTDWPETLATWSEAWPQHLHNSMRALAEGLLEAGGRLSDVDAGRVAQVEADLRGESYRARVSPEMDSARKLVAQVMAALPAAGLRRGQVLGEIERAADPAEPEWHLPDGLTPGAFLEQLIHRGALQQGQDDLFRCPIPSFRDYLIELGHNPGSAVEDTAGTEDDLARPAPFDDMG